MKNTQSILLVEDDALLARMISEFLTPHGYDVQAEADGESAVRRIVREKPDAVVLDINLPTIDGFTVCRSVRPDYKGPIIVLTARGDEADEVLGLECGADDYMAKPLRPRALLARLGVHIRREHPKENDNARPLIVVGDLEIDPARRAVTLGGAIIEMTTAEYDLLKLLAENAGQIVSRKDIYEKLHGLKYDGIDRSIDLRVSRLRKKLGDEDNPPRRVKSVRGVGYLLSPSS